jgi:hypothetical protein
MVSKQKSNDTTIYSEALKDFRIAINQLVDDDNMPEVLALIEQYRERAVREARIKDYKHTFGKFGEFNLLDDVIIYGYIKSRLYYDITESGVE